jgi:H-type small acid-soluble spore protein
MVLDIKRAKEIMESQGVIDVNYMDSSVWIEDVHEDDGNVGIKIMKTGEKKEVPVEYLKEDAESWME